MPCTSMIPRTLNFEGPHTGDHGVPEVTSLVQPPPTAMPIHVDPMDIIQDASNRLGTRPINTIGGDIEQEMAQNPPRLAPEIREVGTEAI